MGESEYRLSKGQQRAVMALARERQQIVEAANAQVAEVNAAIDELAGLYGPAVKAGSSRHFEQREGQLVLVVSPAGEAAEEEEGDAATVPG